METTQRSGLAAPAQGTSFRRAAWGLSVGGGLWSLAFAVADMHDRDPRIAQSLGFVALIAMLWGTVELGRARPHGTAILGSFGFAVAALGPALLLIHEATYMRTGQVHEAMWPWALISPPLGMAIAGFVIVRARRVGGWARWIPLAVGALPLVVLAPLAALTRDVPFQAVIAWGLLCILLGVAAARFARDTGAAS